jgi:hypothetical protein
MNYLSSTVSFILAVGSLDSYNAQHDRHPHPVIVYAVCMSTAMVMGESALSPHFSLPPPVYHASCRSLVSEGQAWLQLSSVGEVEREKANRMIEGSLNDLHGAGAPRHPFCRTMQR